MSKTCLAAWLPGCWDSVLGILSAWLGRVRGSETGCGLRAQRTSNGDIDAKGHAFACTGDLQIGGALASLYICRSQRAASCAGIEEPASRAGDGLALPPMP